MNTPFSSQSEVDLTNCEREPIHIPGKVQSHGFLLAVTTDTYTIVQGSANIHAFTGVPIEEWIGKKINSFGSHLPELLNVGKRSHTFASLNPYQLSVNGQDMNLIVHEQEQLLVLEFEPPAPHANIIVFQRVMAQALSEIQSSKTLQELMDKAAMQVQKITGYDRIMIYKFSPDLHGQVLAEVKKPELESFLGLHYPASDIPRQARELYKINLVRLIADVHAEASVIEPSGQPALDLTHSVLRAVSPIHIQYLKNMGVEASMSISLLYRGELWGLIACHNYTPRFIDYSSRESCKLIGQLFSAALEYKKDEEDQKFLQNSLQTEQFLYEKMLKDSDVPGGLFNHASTLLDITEASGAALLLDEKLYTIGQVPDEAAIRLIANWLTQTNNDSIFHTHQLPLVLREAENFKQKASGLLAVTLFREMNEYILWFKPEKIQSVTWAGNPEKAVETSENGLLQLSPRKSFAKWTEEVNYTSDYWRESEIHVASKLRDDVLHIISQKANEIRRLNEKLKAAYEELDAFSYTVSHDLRTPLTTIKSYAEIIMEEYGSQGNEDLTDLLNKIVRRTDKMNELIQEVLNYSRLGRTELTKQPIPMQPLLEEIREEVMLSEKRNDLAIEIGPAPTLSGDPIMINQLFSNLINNAAKYSRYSKPAQVYIEGQIQNNQVIYSIRDNGIGINELHAGKIFDLFKRMDNTRDIEGSGIGLAIAKRIVHKHQGKIGFESKLNAGTTFYVSFPIETNG